MITTFQWINASTRVFWRSSADDAADFAGVIVLVLVDGDLESKILTRREMTAEHFAQIQVWACEQAEHTLNAAQDFYLAIQTEAQDELDRRLARDTSEVQI
jgi:hypothetical protein